LGLLESVWQFRWLVVGVTLLSALSGFGLSLLQETRYVASAELLLADPRTAGVFDDSGVSLDPSRYVRNQAERVRSTPVLARAAELLGEGQTIREIADDVTAQPSVDLDLITIRADRGSAREAAALANAVAEGYQQVVTEEVSRNAQASIDELEQSKTELNQRIATAEAALLANPADSAAGAGRDAAVAQLITIDARANQIAVDASLYGSGVELFEEAEVPSSPSQPTPLRNAVVAAVLGALAASAFAWWRAEQTLSADRRQDAAPVLRAPLLGEIPDFVEAGITSPDPTRTAPHSVVAEAYQFVVASLEFAAEQTSGRTLVLTSALSGDGKTVTALNLAIAARRDGRRVLLVDADERMRGLTALTAVRASPGLTDLVDAELLFDDATVDLDVPGVGSLTMVPAGEKLSDPAGFFRSAEFRKAMVRVQEQAEFVLVDSPPLLAVADTSALAGQADGIVLVVSRGTSLRLLEDVRARLDFVGTPLLGYVFNRARPERGRYGRYGSYGGYGYGYGSAPDADRRRRGDRPGRRARGRAPVDAVDAVDASATGAAAEPAPPPDR